MKWADLIGYSLGIIMVIGLLGYIILIGFYKPLVPKEDHQKFDRVSNVFVRIGTYAFGTLVVLAIIALLFFVVRGIFFPQYIK
jgi:hypothetical protein